MIIINKYKHERTQLHKSPSKYTHVFLNTVFEKREQLFSIFFAFVLTKIITKAYYYRFSVHYIFKHYGFHNASIVYSEMDLTHL